MVKMGVNLAVRGISRQILYFLYCKENLNLIRALDQSKICNLCYERTQNHQVPL